MSSQEDAAALRERVDELEATVQKMLPGRRAFLAGAAGAAVGAVGMQSASNVGEASDGTAVGQIGTSSEKVNVVAHDVTSDLVDTDKVNDKTYLDNAADIKTEIENASSGDQFVIEKGNYTIDNPLAITSEIEVSGLGSFEGTTLTKANDASLVELRDSRIRLINLNFEGINGTTDGIYTADAYGTDRWRIEDCRIANMGNDGIHMGKGNLSHIENCTVVNNGRHGFYSGGTDANAYTVINLNAKDNGSDGYHNAGSYGVSIVGGYAPYNSGAGWYLDGRNINLLGPGGEGNTDDTVVVGPNGNFVRGSVGEVTVNTSNSGSGVVIFRPSGVIKGSNGHEWQFDDSGRFIHLRNDVGPIVHSADGTSWQITVDNSGNIVTTDVS